MAAAGVCLRASIVSAFSAEISKRSSLRTPRIPLVAPKIRSILPDLTACWMTPQELEFITAVGPPDWATIAFATWAIGLVLMV